MCGIVGVVARSPVNQLLYDGMPVLQHRGQDAAGIVTAEGHSLPHAQGERPGARRVPHARHAQPRRPHGHRARAAIPTAGSASSEDEAQPFYVNSPFGIVLGAQRQPDERRRAEADELFRSDRRHVNTELRHRGAAQRARARAAATRARPASLDPDAIFKAVSGVHRRVKGAVRGGGDDRRLRPARVPRPVRHPPAHHRPRGYRQGRANTWSRPRVVALERLGFEVVRDVAPGEAIFIDERRQLPQPASAPQNPTLESRASSSSCTSRGPTRDRRHLGLRDAACAWASSLADQDHREVLPKGTIDVVMPIPDSIAPGGDAGRREARTCEYREGFFKNRYIGRTFIMPGQAQRKKSVRQKLNAMAMRVQGQERAAGGRFDRARHHQQRDRADGARERREEGVLRLGGAAGALPQRVRHRHAHARRADRGRADDEGVAQASAPTR